MMRIVHEFPQHDRAASVPPRRQFARRQASRLAIRKMCVSTAIVGWPRQGVQQYVGGLRPDTRQRFQEVRRAFGEQLLHVGDQDAAGHSSQMLALLCDTGRCWKMAFQPPG